MSKFYVWIDHPTEQILTPQNFNSNDQRIRGFVSGEKISSVVNNTAIRQANLIAVALMEALDVSDEFSVLSSVEDLTNEIRNKLSASRLSTDVQINGVSITENGVANIPILGQNYNSYAGLVVVGMNSALPVYATPKGGLLLGNNDARIANKNSENAIRNMDLDFAMVVGLTTNTKVLTDPQKASAQEWLGVKLYQHEVHFRVGADYPKAYLRVNFMTRSAVALTKNEIWQHLTNTDYTKGAMGYVMVTKDDNTLVYCPILYTLYAPVDVNIAYLLPDGTMGNIYCYESDIDYDPQWDDKVISI